MKKITYRLLGLISALAMIITTFSSVLASYRPAEGGAIYKYLSPTDSNGLSFEASGPVEQITTTADGWIMQAGGNVASTHYARARYKLPEATGAVFTYFYAKAVIVLPSDFYTQQNAGFRILNTDNYPTTLNGATVGAANADELRVSVYMFSDHKIRVFVDHQNGTKLTLYSAPNILPTGEHTFELAGDVSQSAPWYLKIDGVVVASGTTRLSTDDTAASERVVTRIVAGIDGAADQDNNSVNLLIKSLEIANYDVSGASATSVPATATFVPTFTTIPPSPTFTATASPVPTQPTATRTIAPTVTIQPTNTIVAPSVVDIRVASGKDDVEEYASGGMYINSSDLELVYDGSSQLVGLRFTNVKIPKGAVITDAYIQFKADAVSTKIINLTIKGEVSANASAFSSTSRNVSKRLRTLNTVTWSPAPWSTVGEMRTSQRTPNLNTIIQEIVSQSNWNSGNALVMIFTGSTDKRVAKSFEGGSSGAPLLHVEFSIPAVP